MEDALGPYLNDKRTKAVKALAVGGALECLAMSFNGRHVTDVVSWASSARKDFPYNANNRAAQSSAGVGLFTARAGAAWASTGRHVDFWGRFKAKHSSQESSHTDKWRLARAVEDKDESAYCVVTGAVAWCLASYQPEKVEASVMSVLDGLHATKEHRGWATLVVRLFVTGCHSTKDAVECFSDTMFHQSAARLTVPFSTKKYHRPPNLDDPGEEAMMEDVLWRLAYLSPPHCEGSDDRRQIDLAKLCHPSPRSTYRDFLFGFAQELSDYEQPGVVPLKQGEPVAFVKDALVARLVQWHELNRTF